MTDFNVNFIDRQTLKILEDSIIDLQVILPTLLSTIIGIRDQCKKYCERHHGNKEFVCDCNQIIDEFDEHAGEAEGYVERAKALKARAKSSAQLVSFATLSSDKLLNRLSYLT